VSAFVLDASVALSWCFPDEASRATEALLGQVGTNGALVPDIWPLEVANVVLQASRAKRIDLERVAQFFAMLAALPVETDTEAGGRAFGAIYGIAAEEGLTVYDAAYLDLARRRRLPLATKDKDLARAARRNGVKLLLRA
jgi:predicted nucleic acid-binding protein